MSADGIWYVKLADGDVERVTLDQLDDAFQKGQIDENTMVLADGANQWMKLADLLGLSETPPPAAPVRAPARAPVAFQPPVPQQRPLANQPPLSMRPPAVMPSVPVARSLRPVSFDLGSDVDLGGPQFRKSSRKRWVVGALSTALVLGTGAFFVTKQASMMSTPPDATPQFAAAAALPPPEATPPPVAVAPATPTPQQAAMAGPSSVMDPTTRRLTDDQKRKLVEAEKSAKPHAKSHGGGGGGGASWHPKEKSTAFTTDGNKFDPLNSTL